MSTRILLNLSKLHEDDSLVLHRLAVAYQKPIDEVCLLILNGALAITATPLTPKLYFQECDDQSSKGSYILDFGENVVMIGWEQLMQEPPILCLSKEDIQ